MFNNLYKSAFGFAVVALALTACSSDEPVAPEQKAQQGISFNVVSNPASRAANYFKGKGDIKNFNVSAYAHTGTAADGVNYFDTEKLSYVSDAWTYDDGLQRYWPNSDQLDFFAWAPNAKVATTELGTFAWKRDNAYAPCVNGVALKDADQMYDFIYATAYNEALGTKTEGSKQVTLNFSHALTQVGVTATVNNSKMHMEIVEVALTQLPESGDFLFPTKEGDKGTWTNPGTTKKEAKYTFSAVQVADGTTADLTGDTHTFMTMPFGTYAASTNHEGTCIRIQCKIWNVDDKGTKDDTDVYIFGSADAYDDLYIPVSFADWAVNTKVTYNLTFGTGNAGLDKNGKPTIVKLDWDVDYTDWEEADDVEIDNL